MVVLVAFVMVVGLAAVVSLMVSGRLRLSGTPGKLEEERAA